MNRRWIYFAPLAIVAMVVFVTLGGVLVRWLWNWLLPPLFGVHMITFWQALGILLLCRILFGSFGMGGSSGSRMRRRMRDRWGHMTPEDRERFRQGMRDRWSFGPPAGGSEEP